MSTVSTGTLPKISSAYWLDGLMSKSLEGITEKGGVKKHVGARLAYFLGAPVTLIGRIVDVAAGIFLGLGAIITAGKCKPIFEGAVVELDSASKIFPRFYVYLIKTINPSAEFKSNDATIHVPLEGDGYIAKFAHEELERLAGLVSTKGIFNRHVTARLIFFLLIIVSIITRIEDTVIGAAAVVASFLTLGKIASINHLAFRAFRPTAIVKDLFYYTVKMINPWAGMKEDTACCGFRWAKKWLKIASPHEVAVKSSGKKGSFDPVIQRLL